MKNSCSIMKLAFFGYYTGTSKHLWKMYWKVSLFWGLALWHSCFATACDASILVSISSSAGCSNSDTALWKCAWKSSRRWPKCLGLYHSPGRPGWGSWSWLPPGPTLTIVAIWKVSRQIKDLSITLCNSALQINKSFF